MLSTEDSPLLIFLRLTEITVSTQLKPSNCIFFKTILLKGIQTTFSIFTGLDNAMVSCDCARYFSEVVKMLSRMKRYTPAVNAVNTDKIKIIFFIHH